MFTVMFKVKDDAGARVGRQPPGAAAAWSLWLRAPRPWGQPRPRLPKGAVQRFFRALMTVRRVGELGRSMAAGLSLS